MFAAILAIALVLINISCNATIGYVIIKLVKYKMCVVLLLRPHSIVSSTGALLTSTILIYKNHSSTDANLWRFKGHMLNTQVRLIKVKQITPQNFAN